MTGVERNEKFQCNLTGKGYVNNGRVTRIDLRAKERIQRVVKGDRMRIDELEKGASVQDK